MSWPKGSGRAWSWIVVVCAAAACVAEAGTVEAVTIPALVELLKSTKITVIDVRAPEQFEGGHIPGAISLPAGSVGPWSSDLKLRGQVVVYCACPLEASARRVAEDLLAAGVSRIGVLVGGWEEWVAAGHQVEQGIK